MAAVVSLHPPPAAYIPGLDAVVDVGLESRHAMSIATYSGILKNWQER